MTTPTPTGLDLEAELRHLVYGVREYGEANENSIRKITAEFRRLREVAEAAGEYVRVMDGIGDDQIAFSLLAQAVDRWQKGGV